ncbi:MAG: TadE/TadG family type IV pilus assembly protein [Methylomicrobium sp.]
MKDQRGAAMVEFAIIGLLFFMMLFGIIEFGRAFFTYNALLEATRRGARVAAVCPVDSTGIDHVKEITVFDTPGGSSTTLLGLSLSNVSVKYYDKDMALVSVPGSVSVTDPLYSTIRFVEVSLDQSDSNAFFHRLFIPLFFSILKAPPLTTVLPSESLGRVTNDNPVTKRCCPGNSYGGTLCTS